MPSECNFEFFLLKVRTHSREPIIHQYLVFVNLSRNSQVKLYSITLQKVGKMSDHRFMVLLSILTKSSQNRKLHGYLLQYQRQSSVLMAIASL